MAGLSENVLARAAEIEAVLSAKTASLPPPLKPAIRKSAKPDTELLLF
jgi:hypothetical protein